MPAGELESIVEEQILKFLSNETKVHDALGDCESIVRERMISRATELAQSWSNLSTESQRTVFLVFVHRVVVRRGLVELELFLTRLPQLLQGATPETTHKIPYQSGERISSITAAAHLKRSGTEMKLLVERSSNGSRKRTDHSMHRLLAKARQFHTMVMNGSGRSIAKLAADADVSAAYFARVFRLSFLAPDIVQAIVRNAHSAELTAKRLANETALPLKWEEQRSLLTSKNGPVP